MLAQLLTNIGRGITNGNCSISSSSDILLYVSGHGFNPFRGIAGGNIVDNFIPGKEQESVVIFVELVDGCKEVL